MFKSFGYFIWILILAIGLMVLILATQFLTSRSIVGLNIGTKSAAATFTINNKLQQFVNSAISIANDLRDDVKPSERYQEYRANLVTYGFNIDLLSKIDLNKDIASELNELKALMNLYIANCFGMMDAVEAKNMASKQSYLSSIDKENLNEKIFNSVVTIQNKLETKLEKSFKENATASKELSDYNQMAAFVAILAILIMSTIIFNRHQRQLELINQLEVANYQIQKVSSIKEQFLANMSHEIRTPLNALTGFAKQLQKTKLDNNQKNYVNIIDSSCNNLVHLVNEVLDIAKLESGAMELENAPFELRKLLRNITQVFSQQIKESNLSYEEICDKRVPTYIFGDEKKLQQMLINLLNNAIKFTPAGGKITLTSEIKKETDQAIWLDIKVNDTGIGIDEKMQGQVFERFQQITGAKTTQKGTGLGLTIVKNISELFGGSVSLKSKVGKGSTFILSLPFGKVKNKKFGNLSDAEHDTELLSSFKYPTAKVLVAEDNPVNSTLFDILLKQSGIQAVFKVNGLEILEELKSNSYDMLFLDIQMPEMDGYETITNIRKTNSTLPVVAMTAYVMSSEKEKCFELGMTDYLPKPIEEFRLHELLNKYLTHFKITEPAKKFEMLPVNAETENKDIEENNFSSELNNEDNIETEESSVNEEVQNVVEENIGVEENKIETEVAPIIENNFSSEKIDEVKTAIEENNIEEDVENIAEENHSSIENKIEEIEEANIDESKIDEEVKTEINNFSEEKTKETPSIKEEKNNVAIEEQKVNKEILKITNGDKTSALIIQDKIIKEIPVDIDKIKTIIKSKSTDKLREALHRLISTISPLGENTAALKRVKEIQNEIKDNENEENHLTLSNLLVEDLKDLYLKLIRNA